MHNADYAIHRVNHLVTLRFGKGERLCDSEIGSEFLLVVMESELDCVEPCWDLLGDSTRQAIREMLTEFAARDYYDDRHVYVNDGRTLEQRREHLRKMQPHYREVGEKLFRLLH
jgi:hypothetical protein